MAAVNFYLAPCFPDVTGGIFEALEDPARGGWEVIEELEGEDPEDFPVWRVDRIEGTVTPGNREATERDTRRGPSSPRGC